MEDSDKRKDEARHSKASTASDLLQFQNALRARKHLPVLILSCVGKGKGLAMGHILSCVGKGLAMGHILSCVGKGLAMGHIPIQVVLLNF